MPRRTLCCALWRRPITGVARSVVNGSPSGFSTTTGAPGAAEANGAFSASDTKEYVTHSRRPIPARRSRARSGTCAARETVRGTNGAGSVSGRRS